MSESRSNLELRLELDQQSISGELGLSGGPTRPFTGYTGLIAVLESIRTEVADFTDPGPGETGSTSSAGQS